eukprot:TRINITY_DN5176_c0_g1_i2.p1 TRINITY_DN5176_c0_g1~~TRINITY_DN5176_c0_g1_i2.p1  ORF type:complete len:116 (-),score=27.41 TRINITY_DN5176_c0_g1_i2:376-723(-)
MDTKFEVAPGESVSLLLYKNVTNLLEVKLKLVGQVEAYYVNPKLVVSIRHILIALNQALNFKKRDPERIIDLEKEFFYFLSSSASRNKPEIAAFEASNEAIEVLIVLRDPNFEKV